MKNAEYIIAIELMCAVQAIEYDDESKNHPIIYEFLNEFR